VKSNRRTHHIIWPEYFDSGLSRSEGRRVPKELSVGSPDPENIYNVCRKMGLNPVLEKDSSHPSTWDRASGRVKVPISDNKGKLIIEIAKRLPRS